MSSQRRQLRVQYLGIPGVTYACVDAMVTILTCPFPCRKITVLFCDEHSGDYAGDENRHYAVSFVVWDWLGHEVTIVPDGFGTHAGTGGSGLALVLQLIQFHQIPLEAKEIRDVEQFERINNGYPTARDLKNLREPDPFAPTWQFYADIRAFGPYLWANAIPKNDPPFPYWLLEPELWEWAKEMKREPDTAVHHAARELEIIIREIGGFDAALVGQDLINEAMGKDKPLRPHGATPSEMDAWFFLFRGAIGAFKNPQSHRHIKLAAPDAVGQVLTVNLLIRKLKQDFSEKFTKSQAEPEEEEEPTEDQVKSSSAERR